MPSNVLPVHSNSGKRKRHASNNAKDKIRIAEINFETLAEKIEGRDASTRKKKNKSSLPKKQPETQNHRNQNQGEKDGGGEESEEGNAQQNVREKRTCVGDGKSCESGRHTLHPGGLRPQLPVGVN